MKLAYCDECRTVIAAGEIPKKSVPKHTLTVGKGDAAKVVEHVARLVDATDVAMLPGEKTGAYLKRLAELNAGRF